MNAQDRAEERADFVSQLRALAVEVIARADQLDHTGPPHWRCRMCTHTPCRCEPRQPS